MLKWAGACRIKRETEVRLHLLAILLEESFVRSVEDDAVDSAGQEDLLLSGELLSLYCRR